MKKQFILLAVVGLVLTSCGIYTKYQRPEDITTDGLYGHDLDGQTLDSLSLFVASDTASIASLSWRELFTDPQLQSLIEQFQRLVDLFRHCLGKLGSRYFW